MRLSSVSAKILGAFLAIMAMFGGVTAYGTWATRRLGDELRRISSGYLTLRLEVQDLQTRQDNLLRLLERATQANEHVPIFIKSAVDNARSFRRADVRKVLELVSALQAAELRAGEGTFLHDVRERLQAIERIFNENEEYFDRLYGPPRGRPLAKPLDPTDDLARERLLKREEKLWRDEADLSKMLRGRVQLAGIRLETDARRAQYATLIWVMVAALLAVGVIILAQRSLRPLRRLAIGAKQLARGNLKQRVPVTSNDEIGALAGEFNAMAAALEEREHRLIRSERLAAVGKIAAQITHEVRNPLSSIGLNAELILEELERAHDWNAAEARELTRAIIQEVDRLTGITEQYLRLARLPRPKLEPEDLNLIVKAVLAFVREDLSAHDIIVDARLAESLPQVRADENQLRQALLNLLRNAAEAMPTGGRLMVETRLGEGRTVELHVRDTGEGMNEEVRSHIFDAFFSTKAGGTGLGLALTHQIIVDHSGTIDVESSPGQGSCFIVRLPMGETPASAA